MTRPAKLNTEAAPDSYSGGAGSTPAAGSQPAAITYTWSEYEQGLRSLYFMRAGLERPTRQYVAPRAFSALVTDEVRKDVLEARYERPWLDGLPFWPSLFADSIRRRARWNEEDS